MEKKLRKIIVVFLAVIMVLAGQTGTDRIAKATGSRPVPVIVHDQLNYDDLVLTPGTEKNMKIPLRAVGGYMNNVSVLVSADKTAPMTISNISLSKQGDSTDVLGISESGITYVNFKVKVKETASIGYYPISITVKALDSHSENVEEYATVLTVDAQITNEKAPAQLTILNTTTKTAVVGKDTNIVLQVKNEGEITAKNAFISLDFGKYNIEPKYDTLKVKIGDLEPGKDQYMSFPIHIMPTETAGLKTLTANLVYKNENGTELKDSYEVYLNVKKNKNVPSLSIGKITYNKALKPGNKVVMTAVIENDGEAFAQDIDLKIDDASTGLGSEGLVKNFYTDKIPVGNIQSGKSLEIKIPFIVSKQATGGLKKLVFAITYSDEAGADYTSNAVVYPQVISSAGSSATGKGNIVISNVKQVPEQPEAGDNLNISFDIENKGSLDVNELKLSLDGLTGNTFIPVSVKPYIYIDQLAVGKKKRINIPLTVSDKITEGLNNLAIKYTYLCDGSAGSDSFVIPVNKVKNDLGSKSMPKVIVSKYSTNVDTLRAGSVFKFNFSLKNTHNSVAAKNITVTISQAENIFSVTQGSNSFFINKIAPGKTVKESLEMRVKADATTKAYPIKVVIEYEYDGEIANPETGEVGVTKTEELNLLAVENSRPVIDNINVYSMDGIVAAGNNATLHFEFYNMGKSSLNNVSAYVGGDFKKADGSMYFVGNVAAGAPAYAEFDVIPAKEGNVKGKLKITFEDSNGDQKEITKDFEATVQAAGVQALPGADAENAAEAMNQKKLAVKKAILPLWLFIIIELILFIIFIPISKNIVIKIYKAKRLKDEEENY